jgi:aminobenzoyl-glutamate utilization protein B
VNLQRWCASCHRLARLARRAGSAAAPNPQLDQNKRNVGMEVDAMGENIQKMNDTVFSFAELGFQEFETTKYLTGILEQNGFKIERGVAGIPTAWTARWGSGKPVIALGSDVDCIPQASQKARRRRITIRSSRARRGTAKGTTPACRCRLPRRSRSRK